MQDVPVKTYIKKFSRDAVDLAHWPMGGPKLPRDVEKEIPVRDDDGEIMLDDKGQRVMETVIVREYERAPGIAHCKMVHPDGPVVRLPLYNGSGRPTSNNQYKMQFLPEKMRAGFVPYAVCPKMMGQGDFLPKRHQGGAPCMHAEKEVISENEKGEKVTTILNVPIDDENPCKCIVALMKARNAGQREKTRILEETRKGQATKEAEQRSLESAQRGEQNERLTDLIGEMREERAVLMARLEALEGGKKKK